MPWYKIVLSRSDVAGGALENVQRVFDLKMIQYGGDKDMAVFDCDNHDGSETTIYVTPSMAAVSESELISFSAQEAARPSRSEQEIEVLVAADGDHALGLILD